MGPTLYVVARAFREQHALVGVARHRFAWVHIPLLTVLDFCQWTTSGIKAAPEETREPHLVPTPAATAVGATTAARHHHRATASAASAGITANAEVLGGQGGTPRVGSRQA